VLIRNTGRVFAALNERRGQLSSLIRNSNATFEATASMDAALTETFAITPTFLEESRLTLNQLADFAIDTRPLVRDLQPVADDLRPTVRDLARLAPDLESVFVDLRRFIPTAIRDLPGGQRFLRGAAPTLSALHVFLRELNPVLSFANFNQQVLAGFVTNASLANNYDLDSGEPEDGIYDYVLHQFGAINSTSLSVNQKRPAYDRGLSYIAPNNYKRAIKFGMVEVFDCKPTGGEKPDPSDGSPPCFVQPPSLWDSHYFPRLRPGFAPNVPAPQGTEGTEPAEP